MRYRLPRRGSIAIAAGVSAIALAGCGSSATPTASRPSQEPVSYEPTSPISIPPPADVNPPSSVAPPGVTLTAAAPSGDTAVITMSFGALQPVSSVPDVSSCDLPDDRALAVKVQIEVKVTSSLATSVHIAIGDYANLDPDTNALSTYYLSENRSGPSCSAFTTVGDIDWDSIAPGSPGGGTGYIVFDDVITPKQPGGDLAAIGYNLLTPDITLGSGVNGQLLQWKDLKKTGPALISCSYSDGGAYRDGIFIAGTRPKTFDFDEDSGSQPTAGTCT